MADEGDSLGGRLGRYARVGASVGGLAARLAGERYLGLSLDRDKHATELKAALGGLKGPLMKAAQLLATIPDALPPEYARELAELRALPRSSTVPRARSRADLDGDPGELATAQADLAAQLAGVAPAPSPLATRIGSAAIERARNILHRKRCDDALPLLANLSRAGARVRCIAAAALPPARPPTRAAPADAWRIAEAALADAEFADAAAVDRLVLRARFTGLDGPRTLRPRSAPFYGSAVLANGRRVHARKGVGALAAVSIHEGR